MDRGRTLGELGATLAILLAFSGAAFLTVAGLWRLRRWTWWLAMGLPQMSQTIVNSRWQFDKYSDPVSVTRTMSSIRNPPISKS